MQNADGSAATVEKLDDTTVQWTFAEPNTTFLLNLANMDGADRSITNLAFVPAHYLEQFHPDFVDEAELQAKVAERGFQTWGELFAVEALPHMSGHRPSTAAWVPDGTTVADEVFVIKRNPYYFAVDAEGNQLPYIDEVRFTFFADAQSLNLAAIGGEIDMQGRHIIMSNYPVLVENAEKSGYRVLTYPTFGGSDAVLMLNQTYVKNPAIGELLQNKDFRIALSHAIDREAIKELAFLGIGEARQPVPAPNHPYYPGDEHAFKYTEHDVDKANQLLDGIGLTERDGQGFRLLPNGERLDLEISVVPAFANWPDIGQLVVEDWADVGVRAHIEIRERTPHFGMRDSGDLMIEIWNEDTDRLPVQRPAQVRRAQQSQPHAGAAEPAMDQHQRRPGRAAGARAAAPDGHHRRGQGLRPRASGRARPRAVPDLDRQRLGDRHGRPHADGAGRDRRQREPAQRARGRRQRLAPAHARQHPTGAVLLRAVNAAPSRRPGLEWP